MKWHKNAALDELCNKNYLRVFAKGMNEIKTNKSLGPMRYWLCRWMSRTATWCCTCGRHTCQQTAALSTASQHNPSRLVEHLHGTGSSPPVTLPISIHNKGMFVDLSKKLFSPLSHYDILHAWLHGTACMTAWYCCDSGICYEVARWCELHEIEIQLCLQVWETKCDNEACTPAKNVIQ